MWGKPLGLPQSSTCSGSLTQTGEPGMAAVQCTFLLPGTAPWRGYTSREERKSTFSSLAGKALSQASSSPAWGPGPASGPRPGVAGAGGEFIRFHYPVPSLPSFSCNSLDNPWKQSRCPNPSPLNIHFRCLQALHGSPTLNYNWLPWESCGQRPTCWSWGFLPKGPQSLSSQSFFCLLGLFSRENGLGLQLLGPQRDCIAAGLQLPPLSDSESPEPLAVRAPRTEGIQLAVFPARPAGPVPCCSRCRDRSPSALGTEVVWFHGVLWVNGQGGEAGLAWPLAHPPGLLQIMPRSTWPSCRRRLSRSQAACSASPSSTATITRSTSSMPGTQGLLAGPTRSLLPPPVLPVSTLLPEVNPTSLVASGAPTPS